MKNTILLTFLALVVACSTPEKKESTKALMPNWLEGKWVRTNDGLSKITYEEWTIGSAKEYTGQGYTIGIDSSIFEPDTVFMEQLRVLTINDTLSLEITGVNENPTLFRFIAQTDTSFICVNPENEFPKKISYSISNDHLTAVISGPGQDISFIFRRE